MRQEKENFNNNKKMNSEVKFADLLADESINENTNPKSANTNMNDNIITSDFTNVSKNAPCPCGSGKKFKMCCSSAPLQSELKKQQDAERKLRAKEIEANAVAQKQIEDAERAERARVNKERKSASLPYVISKQVDENIPMLCLIVNPKTLNKKDGNWHANYFTHESTKKFQSMPLNFNICGGEPENRNKSPYMIFGRFNQDSYDFLTSYQEADGGKLMAMYANPMQALLYDETIKDFISNKKKVA